MTQLTVTHAYVTHYDEVFVNVEPFIVEAHGRKVMVRQYRGDKADRGDYLVGRGEIIKKDGTVGVRTVLVGSGHTPQVVRDAAAALFA